MSQELDFPKLLQLTRQRDQRAAAQLLYQFRPAVLRTVRSRLVHFGLQKWVDPEDVGQTVFANLFARLSEGQFQLEKPEDLARLLTRFARNQVVDELRKFLALSRGEGTTASDGLEDFLMQIPGHEATPSKIVANDELIEELYRRLSSDERVLADHRAAGRDWADIALKVGGTAEGLRKKLSRAYERVRRELGIDSLPPP